MKCPNCDSILSLKNNRCERCGEDVRVYKKVVKASNAFYNQGLMKAKVRDLSGAAIALRQSLELDKRNTNARNLLGLVYFEMGETVSALSEWVLSKHFQSYDNDADEYMNAVQSSPNKLENLNQAIKKYNSALSAAKQGNLDLAIIQLKKVISLNPKFIRAYQLLALALIQTGEKEKASKILLKASAIDVNNTITLNYLNEVGISSSKAITEQKEVKPVEVSKSPEFTVFTGMSDYKEDKPNVWAYLNLVIGVVLGIAVFYFLITPTVNSKNVGELNKTILELQAKNSSLEADKTSLTSQNEKLTAELEALKKEIAAATPTPTDPGATTDPNTTDPTVSSTEQLLNGTKLYLDGDTTEAAATLVSIDYNSLEYDAAKNIYDFIKDKSFDKAARAKYSEAMKLYEAAKYEEAIPVFLQATSLRDDYQDATYFLGRSYERTDKKEEAIATYTELTEKHPTSKRGKEAANRLSKLQG